MVLMLPPKVVLPESVRPRRPEISGFKPEHHCHSCSSDHCRAGSGEEARETESPGIYPSSSPAGVNTLLRQYQTLSTHITDLARINQLAYLYAECIDKKLWNKLLGLMTPEVKIPTKEYRQLHTQGSELNWAKEASANYVYDGIGSKSGLGSGLISTHHQLGASFFDEISKNETHARFQTCIDQVLYKDSKKNSINSRGQAHMDMVLVCSKAQNGEWKIVGTAMSIKWIENATTRGIYGANGPEANKTRKNIVEKTLRFHRFLFEESKETKDKKKPKAFGGLYGSSYVDDYSDDYSDFVPYE